MQVYPHGNHTYIVYISIFEAHFVKPFLKELIRGLFKRGIVRGLFKRRPLNNTSFFVFKYLGRFQLITIYNLDTLFSPKMTFLYGLVGIDRTGKVPRTSSPNLPYFHWEQKF